MSNANDPKAAILYARVSTEEQARSGYSLRQQLERLREYAASEGLSVLEEVVDPGQSGADLERPGMDRVRDLVAAGEVSVVLAQDRDRFTREPAYHYLLKREFGERGTRLSALNDHGDDSPEGQLTDGILDQLAKYERAKLTERTRRGKLRKAKEGKIIGTKKPPYGFRYTGDSLVIYEPEMAVVERIFRLAAEDMSSRKIQSRLHAEGIPSPTGGEYWPRAVLRRLVLNDIYRPHTYEETVELVSAEVAARLEPGREYGIRWWNRSSQKRKQVSEPDGNGQRRYQKRYSYTLRDREEWIAAPAPSYLNRSLVDQARTMTTSKRSPERKNLTREWELRGIIRCECGAGMGTQTTNNGHKLYYYYRCNRVTDYLRHLCTHKSTRAENAEEAVWEFVSSILRDPERIRAGMEELIRQELDTGSRQPEQEAGRWAERLEECARLRKAYQEQQAAGLMDLDELREKLGEIENTRKIAQTELDALSDRMGRVEQLKFDRDALMEQMSGLVPEALDDLTPEQKNQLYRMLRLKVISGSEGYAVSGAFSTPEPLSA